tara:strand:- start:390 stop:965 length:576 start_codon:yes stop_codon:yes gene_type:complete
MSLIWLTTKSGEFAMSRGEFDKVLDDGKVLRKLFTGECGTKWNPNILRNFHVDRDIFLLIKAIVLHQKIPSDPQDVTKISSTRFREQCESLGGFNSVDEICLEYMFTPHVPMTPQTDYENQFKWKWIVVRPDNKLDLQIQLDKCENKDYVCVGESSKSDYLYMRKKRRINEEDEEEPPKKRGKKGAGKGSP